VSYHGVGAGPGPVKTYKVDMPLPWGDNTEITLPVQQMVADTWAQLLPKIIDLEKKLIGDMEDEVKYFAPVIMDEVITKNVRPELEKQMEIAFAQVDVAKTDAIKAAAGIATGLALVIGLSAWWIKKGG
jgi:hypothetical protein